MHGHFDLHLFFLVVDLHLAIQAKVQLQRQVRVGLKAHAGDLDARFKGFHRTPDIGADRYHQITAGLGDAVEIAQAQFRAALRAALA